MSNHISNELRQQIIDSLIDCLVNNYVFPDKAEEAARHICVKAANHEYDHVTSGETLASLLNIHMSEVIQDNHLLLQFDPFIRQEHDRVDMEEMRKDMYAHLAQTNYGFQKVERLQGNIGYIELTNFEDPAVGGETAAAAMNLVANTEALIFDLRKNGGGTPYMVALLSSYLFEGNVVHLNNIYWREDESTVQTWTLPFVPGKRYVDKPVYILTSSQTFSAAEEFTYNLKHLKRATIIGEVTKGGANPCDRIHLHDHFVAFMPVGCSINPVTGANWEGSGVIPDIEVTANEAFQVAYAEALRHVQRLSEGDIHTVHPSVQKEVEERLKSLY
ncbi:S41 family peptidase [Paenibacillus assamensis]|uniref:S41 family peptidase n=1 Tax=Paenibacillus assamensis TaxID=311244 RepID=UPI00041D468A|nr:S41 family peptidase [Paenibacillus assamensis]